MYDKTILLNELNFKASRSSGAGGQHVNKVASKIELSFNVVNSLAFTHDETKQRLLNKFKNRLTKTGTLVLQCDESRSQHKNKDLIIKRFTNLIEASLKIPKRRIRTKIPKPVIRKRLKNKRNLAEKKVNRKKPDID